MKAIYGLIVIPFVSIALAFSAGRYVGRQEGTFTFQQHPPERPVINWQDYDKRLSPCAIKIYAKDWNRIEFGGATIHGSVLITNADHLQISNVNVRDSDIGVYVRTSEKATAAIGIGGQMNDARDLGERRRKE